LHLFALRVWPLLHVRHGWRLWERNLHLQPVHVHAGMHL